MTHGRTAFAMSHRCMCRQLVWPPSWRVSVDVDSLYGLRHGASLRVLVVCMASAAVKSVSKNNDI